MALIVVLAISIALQFLAAVLALRLVRVTGRWRAWTLIAAAISLMAVRRSITFYRLVSADLTHLPDLHAELVALIISLFMVVGVAYIAPIFLSIRRSEEALRETRDYLSNLIDYANAPIIVWDPQFRVTRFNDAFERLTGRTADELVGGPLDVLFPDEQREDSLALIERTAAGERWEAVETPIVRTDGTVRTVLWNSATLYGEDGTTVVATIAQGQDITERKGAEEGMRRLATVVLDSNDAVTVQDLEGNITAWNRGAERMYGWSEEEALDMNIRDTAPEEQREEALAFVEAMRRGELVESFETKRVTKDGRVLDAWLTVTKLVDDAGALVGVVTTERDITERKGAEEELRKLNEELERRVADRTAALEAANKELEAFAYSVSHDLRAPLRSMDGFSQALLEDYADKVDEQGKDYLQRVRAASQNMGQLIDDLLKLSRITRAEMIRATVDLSAMAREILTELEKGEPERQVEFVVQDGVTAVGDPRLLQVLLENLLGNAWKFTGKQATAKIEFGTTEHEAGTAYFVRDDGVGFDMAYADKLFGAFQRLHSATDFPGTGIGLATVQRIIHRHGGHVWGEGVVEKGATFYFAL